MHVAVGLHPLLRREIPFHCVASRSNRRREQEQTVRIDWVLAAAEVVFVQRGFRGASVTEIARRADVALATLYKIFPSKEALFAAVMTRRMEGFLAQLRAASAVGTPRVRLQRFVEAMFVYFVDRGEVFRMYLAATHGFPWHIRSRLGERAAAGYRELVGVVEGMCRQALPPRGRSTAHATALAVVGTLNALLSDWIQAPRRRGAAIVAAEAWTVVGRLLP